MSETVKERKDVEDKYKWDLSTLYANDEAWEADYASVKALLDQAKEYEGTLKDAKSIRKFFDYQVKLERKVSNFYNYASLRLTEDTRDSKAQTMDAKVNLVIAEYMQALSFADPEILSLDDATLAEVVKAPELEPFAFRMQKLMDEKPHVLSAENEALLAAFTEVLQAPDKISENLQDADLKFDDVTDSEGNVHQLTQANFILLQHSKDRVLRENAFRSYYKGYRDHINTFSAAYNGCVKGSVAEAQVRHYENSRAMHLAHEHVPASVYDGLVDSVHKFMPLMYRYVALRKKILGVDELHYYDLYTPLTSGSNKSYTYEEAQQMVLDAVQPLGKEYVARVQQAYDDRWIDAMPNQGKRGGAFSSGTYDSNPFILTSFTGTLDSVSTLAHEMGHSQHTWLSNHTQEPQNADYTLFVAEVASTVNENLLVEQLLAKTTDPMERLALLNQYLEGFKGTVYRQTMFAEFEREAHAMAERGEALTQASLNALYKKLIEDYFGPELVIDDEVQYEWARIPHFYRPFYVFKYATSYSAAVALSEAVLNDGEEAVKRYLEFLSMGGSAYPIDELKHAGVDFTSPEPVDRALEKFGRILDDAEATYEKLQNK
ncbi:MULTISPECIES: oligoendopeptidase F [Agathobacter]|uniref:Oligopeptidase F n=1 Tax=Agathobacter ruminis TaxID=1712665 RepID=A0A2G3E3Y7_9FIRM|nr:MULTISPECIES: oligoendopeptidase F [Agathobacter]MBQ1681022.1 oligoendopeptidase F [Agathobacter sp.]MDC7302013.1 oligoendopeptidase F [Agathobacter ruminis]PHU37870.1 oligoendopeptidase F [Agathobacter ruminis]